MNREVVNLSLHVGLGLSFMVHDVIDEVHEGDLLVILPEYSVLVSPDWQGSTDLGRFLLEVPRGWRSVGWSNLPVVLWSYPLAVQNRLLTVLNAGGTTGLFEHDPIYHRAAFNEWGDVVSHLGASPACPSVLPTFSYGPLAGGAAGCLRRLECACQRRGAEVVVFPPCLLEESFVHDREAIERLWGALRSELGDAVRGEPAEYAMPRELVFDTVYHLNARGVERRTRLLERDLAEFRLPGPRQE